MRYGISVYRRILSRRFTVKPRVLLTGSKTSRRTIKSKVLSPKTKTSRRIAKSKVLPTERIRCRLLELPLELRQRIYHFALFDAPVITINACDESALRCSDLSALFLPRLDAAVLQLKQPASATRDSSGDNGNDCPPALLPSDGSIPLLHANRQIREEILSYLDSPVVKDRKLTLYMSYPYGLLALEKIPREFLCLARIIRIGGYYRPPPEQPEQPDEITWAQNQSKLPLRLQLPQIDAHLLEAASHVLARLTHSVLGMQPQYPVDKLVVRMHYHTIYFMEHLWKLDTSPIALVLQNSYAGARDIFVEHNGKVARACIKVVPDDGQTSLQQRWGRLTPWDLKTFRQEYEDWVANPEWLPNASSSKQSGA